MYAEYNAKDECDLEPNIIAQVHLAFSIAATSTDHIQQESKVFEAAWQSQLTSFEKNSTVELLQLFLLAQLFYIVKPDHAKLLRYWEKSVAVFRDSTVQEHLASIYDKQPDGAINSSICQSLYVLDRFSAALLGLPQKLNIEEIGANLPTSTKPEINPQKCCAIPPVSDTQHSAALALFHATRILSKVLDGLYSANVKPEPALSSVMCLEKELDTWYEELPSRLRLQFVHDKPSTSTVGSRAPLLVKTSGSI